MPRKQKEEKFATEMDFDEFVQWAREYVVESFLDEGIKGIKESIFMVVHQAACNQVFGGKHQNPPRGS